MWLIRVIIVLSVLWLLAAFIGWMIRRTLLKAIKGAGQKTSQKQTPALEKPLVACHTCGTFIDKQSALENKGLFYCSEEHMDNT